MDKPKKTSNWLKSKPVITGFAIIALVGAFLFMNENITGSAILANGYSFDMLSLIGLLLVACAIILAVYNFRKKK